MSSSFLDRVRLWLRANVFRRRYEREMREEMAAHLERATALLVARGLSPEAARRQAVREFGDVERHHTEGRESRGTLWLDAFLDDTRYGIRQLMRAPVFTLVASLSVAIGIIVAVGAFTLINAVLFKPLPVADANGIYHVYTSDGGGRDRPYGSSSYPDYLDFEKSGAFRSLAAAAFQQVAVSTAGGNPSSEFVSFVSQNYFTALGLIPARGRVLGSSDESGIVLAWAYWQRVLGGDAAALGTTININGTPLTIVGVAPESFRGVGLGPPLVGWIPAAALPAVMHDTNGLRSRGSRGFTVIGRLRDGETAGTAATRLNATAVGLASENPNQWIDRNGEIRLVSVLSHRESLAPPGQRAEIMLGLIAGGLLILFVIMLACTNVAALLLGRAVGRDQEISMRLALGATRGRLMRQLLTESMLLALIGAAVSLMGLVWTIRIVTNRVPFSDMFDLSPDWRVLTVALIASIICALIFGLAPALHSVRLDLRSALSGTASSPARNRLRGGLIALQVAASCVLIMLAFSAVRGVRTYAAIDPGIELDGLVSMEIDRDVFGDDTVRAAEYTRQIREIVATAPGLQGASLTSMLPLGNGTSGAMLSILGDTAAEVEINTVNVGFFDMLQLKALRGRAFDATDTRTSPPVAVVNRAFIEKFGPEAFGTTVTVAGTPGVRIVGVVPDINYHSPRKPQASLIYVVADQIPWEGSTERFLMKVPIGAEAGLVTALRDRIRNSFPDLVMPRIETLRQHTARQTMPHRVGANVALGIGGIELALATVGLYGLLMFALLARTREIGVRLALGASGRQASWAVMREGMRYAAFGAVGGLLLAVPAAIAAQNALPGARASDPLPFIAAFGAVLLASLAAAYVPLRRAGNVQPASVLRQD